MDLDTRGAGMSKKILAAAIWVTLLISSFPLNSQQSSQVDNDAALDRLRAALKVQFRDTAELHVHQTISFTVTDARGRVRKKNKGMVNLLYEGFNDTKPYDIAGEMEIPPGEALNVMMHGLHKVAATSDFWSIFPVVQILMTHWPVPYDFAFTPGGVKMTPRDGCQVFTMEYTHRPGNWPPYWPDLPCGTGEFQLDRNILQRFDFEADGLPVQMELEPFKKCTLKRYHSRVEYHTIMLPNDADPFVVPQRVTTTLETDKGTIEIVSSYEPNEPPGKNFASQDYKRVADAK